MSKSISATDAKNNFGGLLDDVAVLGRVDIVKHGRLVAVMLSPGALDSSVSAGVVTSRARPVGWKNAHDPRKNFRAARECWIARAVRWGCEHTAVPSCPGAGGGAEDTSYLLAARAPRWRPGARLLGGSSAGRAPGESTSGVTSDGDFIGDSVLAKDLAKRLGWQIWIPTLDDPTPQTGKVTQRTKNGEVKQVDFLSGVAGLTTKDLIRRAIEMEVPEIGRLRVIHPVDVLVVASRIWL